MRQNNINKIDKTKHSAGKIRIAILFSGNGSNLENIVTHFRANEFDDLDLKIDFALAICNKEGAYGITRCENLGLKCEILPHKNFKKRADFDKALANLLRQKKIDLVVLAGFMRILGGDFVREFRAINIHPSFLPLHKGANAIKDSYYANEDFGGVSVHWVSEELDSGQIIMQQKLPKIKGESLESFEARIHALEYTLYPQAITQAIKSIFVDKG